MGERNKTCDQGDYLWANSELECCFVYIKQVLRKGSFILKVVCFCCLGGVYSCCQQLVGFA